MKNALRSLQPELDGTIQNHIEMSFMGEKIFIPLRSLSEKQKYFLKNMNHVEKLNYLLSLNGNKTNTKIKRLAKPSLWSGDTLALRENNYILNKFKQSCRADKFQSPLSSAFHYGIEIECILSYSSVDASPSDSTCECYNCEGSGEVQCTDSNDNEYYNVCRTCEGSGEIDDDNSENSESNGIEALQDLIKEKGIKGCHVKTDGSIDVDDSSEYFGVEIAILTNDFKNVKKLCDLLRSLGAEVNASCGLHVHLDARKLGHVDDQTPQVHNLKNSLDVLFSILPESRHKSSYCKKDVSFNDRYYAVNCSGVNSRKTIEIRCHSGTTDFDKIKNWCMILKSVWDKESYLDKKITSINSFAKFFEISKDLKDYMIKRKTKFRTDGDDAENEEAA